MPRIDPAPADLDVLDRMMPASSPVPPLLLFRTFARNPAMAEAMLGWGAYELGRSLSVPRREREVVILRTCARCACEYEWGVHVAMWAERAGLTPEQVDATVLGGPDDPAWAEGDGDLVAMVDELHDAGAVTDATWARLAERWDDAQLLDLLALAGWYHAVAYVANGAGVEREGWAARFPG